MMGLLPRQVHRYKQAVSHENSFDRFGRATCYASKREAGFKTATISFLLWNPSRRRWLGAENFQWRYRDLEFSRYVLDSSTHTHCGGVFFFSPRMPLTMAA